MRMHIQYDTSPEIDAQNLLFPAEGNLPVEPSNDIIKLQDSFRRILTTTTTTTTTTRIKTRD
jgi:hypothetical protein